MELLHDRIRTPEGDPERLHGVVLRHVVPVSASPPPPPSTSRPRHDILPPAAAHPEAHGADVSGYDPVGSASTSGCSLGVAAGVDHGGLAGVRAAAEAAETHAQDLLHDQLAAVGQGVAGGVEHKQDAVDLVRD